MEKVINKIERLKVKAELFLSKNIKAFIKSYSNDFYFCDLLSIGEDYLFIQDFTGKRKGEKNRLLWVDIEEIEEYREVGENARST